jgi:AmmeMemoRadiSam system protein B/AmmeMemoRadiSam system protein A
VAVHHLLRTAADAPVLAARPVALVVPHAGWQYSGTAAGAAYRALSPGDFERVVLVAPSHHGGFSGYALDDATQYRTPLGDIPLCSGTREVLERGSLARVVPGVAEPEHAIEIELPFLQATLGGFCLVPVLAGRTDARQERAFARRLARLDDGQTLFVFSTDFTHYGQRFAYTPFGPSAVSARASIRAQDDRAARLLAEVDAPGFRRFLSETGATICGRAGLTTMLELLPLIAPKAHAQLLAHYASGDLAWARDDNSVSYVAMAYTREASAEAPPLTLPPGVRPVAVDAPPLSAELGARLVRLARTALEAELSGGDALNAELAAFPRDDRYEHLQGVFVTLVRTRPDEIRKFGELRGCIGQVEPRYPLYFAVVRAARDAALDDPRFEDVVASELPGLGIEVTVLSRTRPVGSWKEIELGRHGIVLEKDGKGALFLPQVPEAMGWDRRQTLSALAEKAGLLRNAWRKDAAFSVFTGQVFKENE